MSDTSTVKSYLPWLVATALFMEQLDATIVNTAIPSIAASLNVTPLSLKSVVTSYILSLAVGIPVSGWMADRFGTKRVFGTAIAIFTVASVLCGLAQNAQMMVLARLLQGLGGAMMMPVGRLAIIRTFPKSELLGAMNFVILPALIGPLLGPTVGGLIVHWTSWRAIFFVNVPVGLLALFLVYRYMPDYKGVEPRPLDVIGLILFSSGTALLSWLLEIFGEHTLDMVTMMLMLGLSVALLAAYVWHANERPHPLLRLALLKPTAAAAMGMKLIAPKVLAHFGYRQVLVVNTICIGLTIALFALVGPGTPWYAIAGIGLLQGFFNSLQFSSMNTLAYADVAQKDSSMASTIASSFQQLSMSFGLASGSLVTAWFLGRVPQTNQLMVTAALHHAFLALAITTMLSSVVFWRLRRNDGESISRGKQRVEEAAAQDTAPLSQA
jgi:MFS family permease